MGDWDLPTDPLEALREGNPAPFEAFVASHAGLLLAWFRRQGARTQHAEDLTQDVFLKLHRHAAQYRAQERFSAYCFRIARNVWIDDCRRRAVRPRPHSLDMEGSEGGDNLADSLGQAQRRPGGSEPLDAQERMEIREDMSRLKHAMGELSDGHRQVFELGALDGMAYPEIGRILNIPVGTVKSRMFHAVRRLRAAMEGEQGQQQGAE